ncbi:MAG: 1-acyl-sn-glycerol-3-phosphate acyltransferase [Candidatus Omnitrophica bacterium]|nr:1-acyl-sn-glycerol-3-phosphate acyltransferase [Candidatus Omnitrophota bacterium]
MFYAFARFIAFLLFKVFFRLRIFGRENFPEAGPVIIAPNHVSFLDPIIVGVGASRKLSYLARGTLFRFGPFAGILRWLHVSPIKRGSGDINAFKSALNKLSKGEPVLIFPEGTRSGDGSLQEPKSGIGFLQNISKACILPCYVRGSMEAWPRHSKFPAIRPVSIYFGKPMNFEQFTGDRKEGYMRIAEQVMKVIAELKRDADKNS